MATTSLETLIKHWHTEALSSVRPTLQTRHPRAQRHLDDMRGRDYQRYLHPLARQRVEQRLSRTARRLRQIDDNAGLDRLMQALLETR